MGMCVSKKIDTHITPLNNSNISRVVHKYLEGGKDKEDVIKKYGKFSNWDTTQVTEKFKVYIVV
tara:strand:- start:228 stop:419 length:192 start_codon:yes stop_codon:yes gene_type:complete